jgi:hypothetical protein
MDPLVIAEDIDTEGEYDQYDSEPSELGWDPYAGTYQDDEPFGSDSWGEW